MAIKKQRHHMLLGLAFEGHRVAVALLKRSGSQAEVVKTHSFRLALDPMASEPQLVGEEIKNALRSEGIKTTHCVVGVPLSWTLNHSFELPELPDADRQSFIELESERVFPMAPEDLSLALASRDKPEGKATMAALTHDQVARLRAIVRQAGLTLLSITTAVTELARESKDVDALMTVDEQSLNLVFSRNGDVVLLRHINDSPQDEDGVDTVQVVRELRVSLGRLRELMPETPRSIRVLGRAASVEVLIEDLTPHLERIGIEMQPGPASMNGIIRRSGDVRGFESVVAMTGQAVLGRAPVFEFLPPRISPLRKFMRKVSSRGAVTAGVLGLFIVLIVAALFGWQYRTLNSLEVHWAQISPDVLVAEQLQSNLRGYRSWYHNHTGSLDLLHALTANFPETGEVWIRSIKVSGVDEDPELRAINFTGFANSRTNLLEMQGRLSATPGVRDLVMQPIRGENPLVFSMNYLWDPEAAR